MERAVHDDPLHILELVTLEKPLTALDFCYHDESDNLSLLETLDMCITVIAFSADSKRGRQMLTILDATLSMMLTHLHKPKDMKQQKIIHHIAVSMKTMIINCEALAKNYTGPQKATGEGRGSSRVNYGRSSRIHVPPIEPDDDSHSKFYSDSKRYQTHERDIEDSEVRLRIELYPNYNPQFPFGIWCIYHYEKDLVIIPIDCNICVNYLQILIQMFSNHYFCMYETNAIFRRLFAWSSAVHETLCCTWLLSSYPNARRCWQLVTKDFTMSTNSTSCWIPSVTW